MVGGSIAAYKAAELTSALNREGASVSVAMSEGAKQFVQPLTFQSLSGNRVYSDLFDAQSEHEMGHIRLAEKAQVVAVVPATADMLAKMAAGIADDIVLATLLATRAPILVAPAMNVNMWENPLTRRNIETLKSLGVTVVEPENGTLACGWQGTGRLASLARLMNGIEQLLTPQDLAGTHVVVTAGPTREPIDDLRFIGSRSSGKMGYALARVAQLRGARVTLISGPTTLDCPPAVECIQVSTAQEMAKELKSQLACKAEKIKFVFVASVATPWRAEIDSNCSTVKLEDNPDLLELIGKSREELEEKSSSSIRLIGCFSPPGDEEERLEAAQQTLRTTHAQMIVANLSSASFEADTTSVLVVDGSGRQELVAAASKSSVARRIVSVAARL